MSDATSETAPSPATSPVVACTNRDLVTVVGPDAATYLQGQLSQDVAALAAGDTAWTFVLAPQGKVDGWGRIARVADDGFEVLVDTGAGEAWEARLRRFLLRTKADITVTPGVVVLALRGQGATAVLDGLGAPAAAAEPPVPRSDDAADVAGTEGRPSTAGAPNPWRPAGWPTVDGFDLVVGAADDTDVQEVMAALGDAGVAEVDATALDALRIRAGVPAWGSELDGDTIPASVGQWVIDASVSFTKGCYTGQELVARIDSRGGHVPRLLHRAEVQGPPPPPGTAVTVGDGEAGPVTSSAPAGDGSVALVWVARAVAVDPGGTPATAAGLPARLLPPPSSTPS
jgi:folate-binding protein YgfZ